MNHTDKMDAPEQPASRTKARFGGALLFLAAVVLVSSVAACAGTTSSGPTSGTPTARSAPESTSIATAAAPTTAGAPASSEGAVNDLTGFGATQEKWDSTHAADSSVMAGSAYNPGFSSAGCSTNGDEYYAMEGTLNYSMCLPPNQSQSAAQALVMKEFPKDAAILWQGKQTSDEPNECYQMEVHSPTLAATLGGSGDALVEFQTFEPGNSSGNIKYDASNVNNVLLSGEDYSSLSAAPGC